MSTISNYLKDFQDMYVDVTPNLSRLATNLTKVELRDLENYLNRLSNAIKELNTLTNATSEDLTKHYEELYRVFDEKLDYIGDMADVYNYINSYFDMKVVRDIAVFSLSTKTSDTCIYDQNLKGITLKSVNSLFKCSKSITDNIVTFYNTNTTSHSGIHLSSPFLDLLDIVQVTIRKADGTILELEVSKTDNKEYYIQHEDLVSSQIVIQFTPLSSNQTLLSYLQTVNLNLIEYTYGIEGYLPLNTSEIASSDLFSIVLESTIPSNTYANVTLGLELLDINGNVVDTIDTSIPINSNVVCKRLDRVNYNEVSSFESLIIKGKATKSKVSEDYLKSLEFQNEKYVIYIPKDLYENKVNKYLTKLGHNSFRVNTKVVDKIRFNPTLELFSFGTSNSPIIKNIVGVTKNETI